MGRRCASPARPAVNPLLQWCGFTTLARSPRLLDTAWPPGCCVSPMWAHRMMDCTNAWLRTGWAAHRPPLASSQCQPVSQIADSLSEIWFFFFLSKPLDFMASSLSRDFIQGEAAFDLSAAQPRQGAERTAACEAWGCRRHVAPWLLWAARTDPACRSPHHPQPAAHGQGWLLWTHLEAAAWARSPCAGVYGQIQKGTAIS